MIGIRLPALLFAVTGWGRSSLAVTPADGPQMNRLNYLVLALLPATPTSADDSVRFHAALSVLESLESGQAANVALRHEAAFPGLLIAWRDLKETQKAAAWPQMSLAWIKHAEIELASGQGADAEKALQEAAGLNTRYQGRLEYSTKSPSSFFLRLAKLHVAVAESTGRDPLLDQVGYLFRKNGENYLVARQELYPEVEGITLSEIANSERLVQLHELGVKTGKVLLRKTRWLIGPGDSLEEILANANRQITFGKDGDLSSIPIKVGEALKYGDTDSKTTGPIKNSPLEIANAGDLNSKNHDSQPYWISVGVAGSLGAWLLNRKLRQNRA